MARAYTNFAKSLLASGINAGDLSLSVTATEGALFPAAGAGTTFDCVIFNTSGVREVISVTARAGDVFTIVRAQEGTIARAWNAADRIGHRLTAAALNNIAFVPNIQQQSGVWCGTAGGTANALTLTPSPAIAAYVAGHQFVFKTSASANTAAATIAVSGLAAIAAQNNGIALVGGDFEANKWYRATVDASLVSMQIEKLSAPQISSFILTLLAATTAPAARAALAFDTQASLVDYLHIDNDTGHRDLIRGGWMPAFFNQQWGGAPHYFEMVDGATGVPYIFEAATGYVESGGTSPGFGVGSAAGAFYGTMGFKLSQNTTPTAIWARVYKNGNPVDNLEVQVWSDNAGSPLAALGAKGAISGKVISSDVGGQWVRITGVFPALVAGTQYHLVFDKSAGVDVVNNYTVVQSSSKKYPHGFNNQGTAAPVWTQNTTFGFCFLIENPAAQASLQSGGVFSDGKLQFFEGSPLNQSNARVKDLKDFSGLDLTDFTLAIAGNSWTKDRTILDITYGLDHDRIVLRSNITTGFAQLDVYDSAGTKKTITGTVDVSGANSLLGIRVRAKGDGADAVELWENGVKAAASLAAQTISFDKLFGAAKLGTFWLGGGWQVTPVWTKKWTMNVLPSADGATFGGIATEASAFSVSGNVLYQNKNGYTALQDGFYSKTAAALSNANGWALCDLSRVSSSTNTKDSACVSVRVRDGTKDIREFRQEYYHESFSSALNAYPQADGKTSLSENLLVGKGSDFLKFFNGRLTIDGTGLMTTASATNQIDFGDAEVGSGENADAAWRSVAYYSTAWLAPQFTSGSLSELAIWNGDRTALLATLWNSGAPQSVKALCGMQVNIGGKEPFAFKQKQVGITLAPTTTSGSFTLIPEMECFVIGSDVEARHQGAAANSGANNLSVQIQMDGTGLSSPGTYAKLAGTSDTGYSVIEGKKTNFGLHKTTAVGAVGAGTETYTTTQRHLTVEARS